MSAEDAAHELAVDGVPLDQARALARGYLNDVPTKSAPQRTNGASTRPTLPICATPAAADVDGEAERREQLPAGTPTTSPPRASTSRPSTASRTEGGRADEH